MKTFIFSIFLLGNFTVLAKPVHEVPLAIFNLNIEANSVSLDILFDKADLENAVKQQPSSSAFQQQIEDYLLQNMQWLFNQKMVAFEICSMVKNREHYQIKVDFVGFKEELTQVEISNTCLVETIDKHSNILNVFYKKKQRSFRLHKARTKTLFELE